MSDESKVEVKVRADVGEVKPAVDKTASAVEQAAQRMRAALANAGDGMRNALNSVKTQFAGLSNSVKDHMSSIRDSVANEVGAMGGHFSSLFQSLSKTQLGFVALGAAVLGAGMRKAVNETAQMTESAMDLGRALGIDARQASILQATLEDVGASQGEFEGAAKGMSRQLRENEEKMNALGLRTRDAAGNLRPMNELVVDGIAVLNEYREGADRALVSQQIFGRGIDASSKLLLVNNDTITENQKAVEELGLAVGQKSVQAWAEFDAASDRAALTSKSLTKTVGDALMPVMTSLTEMFNSIMPDAIAVLKGPLQVIGTLFLGLVNAVTIVWETFKAFVMSVAEPFIALTKAMSAAMAGDFEGAGYELSGIFSNIGQRWEEAGANMAASSQKTFDRIKQIWSEDTGAGETGGEQGQKTAPTETSTGSERVKVWENELEAQRQAHRMSLQEVDQYWNQIRQRQDLSKDERLAVEKNYLQVHGDLLKQQAAGRMAAIKDEIEAAKGNFDKKLELAHQLLEEAKRSYGEESREFRAAQQEIVQIERQKQEQLKQLRSVQANAAEQAALDEVAAARQAAQIEVELGNISLEQLLAQEAQFERSRYEIRSQALEAKKALIDPSTDPVAYAQINAEIEALARQHSMTMAQIDGEQRIEAQSGWEEFGQSVESLWDKAVNAMMNGTFTWANAMKAVRAEMLRMFLNFVKEKVTAWIRAEVLQTAWTKVQTMARAVLEKLGLATSTAATAASASAKITSNAAVAASGAASSQASIPYVGPILAIAAMGAILASVMSLRGSIKSARGGYDIPSGLNPVTQLHEKEMVLPAQHADTIRRLGEEGGTGSSGGELNINISGMRMGNLFMMHQDELKKALKELHRNNALRPA